jgi:hypothetical protein
LRLDMYVDICIRKKQKKKLHDLLVFMHVVREYRM